MTGHTGVRLYPGSNLIIRAGLAVARAYTKDDADRIVRAVNRDHAFDDLVIALHEILAEHGGFVIKGECERRARAALAKAGSGK